MLERFFPDEYISSTYAIPFDRLYEEGYRGIIFDIDNTLVPHGAPADERAKQLFRDLKELGYSCCLLSNNQEPRVKMYLTFLMHTNRPERITAEPCSLWGRTGIRHCSWVISYLRMYGGQSGQVSAISSSGRFIRKRKFRSL